MSSNPFPATVAAATAVTVFDYSQESQDMAHFLRVKAAESRAHVSSAGHSMFDAGRALSEAKTAFGARGTSFQAWCDSGEPGVKYHVAQRLITIFEKQHELGNLSRAANIGARVFAELAQTSDDDIRQALIAHVEAQAEAGEKITTREVEALKKQLAALVIDAKARGDELGDLRAETAKLKLERDEAREAKERFASDLIRIDKERKAEQQAIKDAQRALAEELRDAQEVYRDQLEEAREAIRKEEAARPRTTAEENAKAARLKALNDKLTETTESVAALERRLAEQKEKMDLDRRKFILWDRVMADFSLSASKYFDASTVMTSAMRALAEAPITDEMYKQIVIIRGLATTLVQAIDDATAIRGAP